MLRTTEEEKPNAMSSGVAGGTDLGKGRERYGATEAAPLAGIRERILTLVRIAAVHGSTISSEELQLLMPASSFRNAEQLARFVKEDPTLRAELTIQGGEVAPRADANLIARRRGQRELALDRLRQSQRFVVALERLAPWSELVAISGSVAYAGAKPDDDVDLFIVTGRNRMWITMFVALGLARLARFRDPSTPAFCLNRVEEIDGCRSGFRESRDPLFAREALNLKILRGQGFYHALLDDAPWMREWFPSLYELRLRESGAAGPSSCVTLSAPWGLANGLALLLLGPYLWMVGAVRNARLQRQGRSKALFRTVVQPAFCAYESQKYEDLGDAYRRAFD